MGRGSSWKVSSKVLRQTHMGSSYWDWAKVALDPDALQTVRQSQVLMRQSELPKLTFL